MYKCGNTTTYLGILLVPYLLSLQDLHILGFQEVLYLLWVRRVQHVHSQQVQVVLEVHLVPLDLVLRYNLDYPWVQQVLQ